MVSEKKLVCSFVRCCALAGCFVCWQLGGWDGARCVFVCVVHSSIPLCLRGDGFYGQVPAWGGSGRGLRPLVVSNHSMKNKDNLYPNHVIFSLFLTD